MKPGARRLVVSTIGASLLYQHLEHLEDDRAARGKLNRVANAAHLASDENTLIESILTYAKATLSSGDVQTIRRKSAELNGIFGLYEGQIQRGSQDVHALIVTDTALGKCCADLVETYLQRQGFATVRYDVEKMTTASSADFETGSKNLIHWCAQTIPGYREQGYTVVFNLVAAFKALQGYLNTIGMFYADQGDRG